LSVFDGRERFLSRPEATVNLADFSAMVLTGCAGWQMKNQTQITPLNYSITRIREAELFGNPATNIKSTGL